MSTPESAIFVVPPGMPAAVFRDKYARRKEDGTFQTWAERVTEMVDGNVSLRPGARYQREEFLDLALRGIIPMSGRHLQHGDLDQASKKAELFMNCTSAMFSWASFLLLMKGAGVGRDFSADMCFVDWDFLPNCRFVLDAPDNGGKSGHPDYEPWIESLAEARHKYDTESEMVRWHEVGDSAEGWAKVVMIMETAAFHKNNRDTVFVFDFSGVRRAGAPLMGQQGRPASGPVPFIKALHKITSIRGAGMKPWKQAMFVDHYLAACVVVGGIRRSARIAVKSCYDRDVIDFIDIKRGGYLWSANNTLLIDRPFWAKARDPRPSHERRVFEAASSASYWDDTGEPGFFNVDLVNDCDRDIDDLTVDNYLSDDFVADIGGLHLRTRDMIAYHLDRAKRKKYRFLPNPCGEIPLAVWGGYCDVGDVCLSNATSLDAVQRGAGILARALVRVNTMRCIYRQETRRTNRIGVSLTGVHEFAWRCFNLSFKDLIAEPLGRRAREFWEFIDDVRETVERDANDEARHCGLPPPVTYTCVKPSGTVGKVMACTEGAHLPAQRHYLRWVMHDAEGAAAMSAKGYPTKDVSHQYPGTVVVGFPTCLPIVDAMPADLLVTASEATPEDQYRWLRLIEKNWLGPDGHNGQISYTLKWRKANLSYEGYVVMLLEHQPTVRACALMPDVEQDASAYAYLPEEPISEKAYRDMMARVERVELAAYDADSLLCEGGACPIEGNIHQESLGISL